MQKVAAFFIAAIILISVFSFTSTKKEKVQWLTVAELQAAYSKNPKPILVDVYTSWCGWCKVMDRETHAKENVAASINEHYYAVKLDAESKESFEWNGKKYEYNVQNKANDLAGYLLYGQMSFPTTVFLPALDAQPAPMAGYLKPAELEAPLKFFGDGDYKTKKYPEFMNSFKPSW
jgi:thioredoxin-related protein